jgi:hypothetical protein
MPRNPDGSVTIRTIGDHLDQGNKISAECNTCQRRVKLDLEKLAEQLGRDHSALVGALGPKLKCSRCGSKGVCFTVHVNAGWDGTGGHSLSRK